MAHYYPKIANAFYREPATGKVDRNKKSDPLYDTVDTCKWIFTEKVYGTSIAVYWNGDKFEFYGHTTRSNIPPQVITMLESTFDYERETLFEQVFGDKPVMVYGEAYGPSIGPGKMYCDNVNFIVFDITVGTTINLEEDDAPVPDVVRIRKWGNTEWVKPCREYMGLED